MNQKLKIATGIISLGLLATLVYKLTEVPGGMFLSGLFLGGMWIIIILIVGFFLTWLTKLILKKPSFWTIYFTVLAIAFTFFHYRLYSPTLTIIVPENYTGEINLVKSNLTENSLIVDTNGIGYLNEWTFEKVYTEPIVVDINGKNMSAQCVGYNPSKFFSLKRFSSSEIPYDIKSLSFSIFPDNKIGDKYFYGTDLAEFVDLEKIK